MKHFEENLSHEWRCFWKNWPYSQEFVHGRFTSLEDKIKMVKRWQGVNPKDIDDALAVAVKDGTISGYESEVARNPFLDIVVVIYLESVQSTFWYAVTGLGDYIRRDVEDIKLIEGTELFIPNQIRIEVVDFGALVFHKNDHITHVQKQYASQLAHFAVLYNARQSPKWIEQTRYGDDDTLPYFATATSLLLRKRGKNEWNSTPQIECRHLGRAEVMCTNIGNVGAGNRVAMPIYRRYNR